MPNTDFLKESGILLKNEICVNSILESTDPKVFSAGDSYSQLDPSPFSVLNAVNQGKIAGHNASSPINPLEIQNSPTAVNVEYNDFELYAVGYSSESCLRNEEILEENGNTYRSIIRDGDSITGIQMIGSSKDFTLYKNNSELPNQSQPLT